MPDQSRHCPFLNRSDARCSGSFQLDHLQHAFKHCFDRYNLCPVYSQLLVERQARRAGGGAGADGHSNFVPLTIAHRHAQPASTAA